MQYRELVRNHELKFAKPVGNGFLMIDLSTPSFREPEEGDRWGNWKLAKNCLIWDGEDRRTYEIDLRGLKCKCKKEDCPHMSEIEHWLWHMATKSAWLRAKDIGDLVFAFMDIMDIHR